MEQIVALKLPNMGLKVIFELMGMLCFGCGCDVLAVS